MAMVTATEVITDMDIITMIKMTAKKISGGKSIDLLYEKAQTSRQHTRHSIFW